MDDVPVACSLNASDLANRMNRWIALTNQAKPVVSARGPRPACSSG